MKPIVWLDADADQWLTSSVNGIVRHVFTTNSATSADSRPKRIMTKANSVTIASSATSSSQNDGAAANDDHHRKIAVVPSAIATDGRLVVNRRTTNSSTVMKAGNSCLTARMHHTRNASAVPVNVNSPPSRTTIGGYPSASGASRRARSSNSQSTATEM